MEDKEAIIKLYDEWKIDEHEHLDYFNEQEKRYIFLADAIVGFTSYDDNLSAEFGKVILDTLTQIKNKTTFDYIQDAQNYKKYILVCNFIENWIDWGTSIRGAWFGGEMIPSEPLSNIGYNKEYIETSAEFMEWFIDWLQYKEE